MLTENSTVLKTESEKTRGEISIKNEVLNQVATDLNEYLKSSPDRKKTLKFISKKIDVHEKTLNRVLNRENKPTYITVFRLYRFLLNENDDTQLFKKVPDCISKYLKKVCPQKFEKSISFSGQFEKHLSANPVMAELYVVAGTGALSKAQILERFGNYGVEVAEKLVKLNAFKHHKIDQYVLNTVQITLSPEIVCTLGQQMVSQHLKPENGYVVGEHFVGFFAEGLSEAAYDEWVKIDEEAFLKKVKLAQKIESQGTKRAFTFNCVETLKIGTK